MRFFEVLMYLLAFPLVKDYCFLQHGFAFEGYSFVLPSDSLAHFLLLKRRLTLLCRAIHTDYSCVILLYMTQSPTSKIAFNVNVTVFFVVNINMSSSFQNINRRCCEHFSKGLGYIPFE